MEELPERATWSDNTAKVDELLKPVLDTSSPDQQQQALHRLGECLSLQSVSVRERAAEALLQKLWIVGAATVEEALCECLVACGRHIAVSAAVRTLKEVRLEDSFLSLERSLTVLRRLLCTRVQSAAQVGEWCQNDWDKTCVERWVSLLLLLPSLIANACHKLDVTFPSWSTQGKYYPRLVDCALEMVMLQDSTASRMYLRTLIQTMLRRGGEEVAVGLYHSWERTTDSCVCDYYSITRTLLHALVPREFAVLGRAMLRHVLGRENIANTRFSHPWLDPTLRNILTTHPEHCNAFVRLLVESSSSVQQAANDDCWKLCYATASLLACVDDTTTCEEDSSTSGSESENDEQQQVEVPGDRVLRRTLLQVAERWSQTNFVRNTDAHLQRHVTHFLRAGMQFLVQATEDATSDLVAVLLEGVTERLSSSNASIRKDGMVVAELMAKRLGEELHFEELEGDRELSWGKDAPVAEGTDATSGASGFSAVGEKKKEKLFISRQTDPDAEYVSDDDGEEDSNDDNSSWDDDSALAPYDLEDDEEDLRETPRPLYLAECLDLLRTSESDDHAASRHETALQEVSLLVRSRPMDLPDLGAALAFELFRFEDKFNTENFTEMISKSLCALAVEEPFSVGKMLIEELFQDISLVDRLNALHALCEAALELSGSQEAHGERLALEEPR
jgi:hypothetical protein